MRVVMELENEEAIERMVGIGVGTGFISRRRADAGSLRYVRPRGVTLLADTSAAYSTRIPMTPATKAFLATCVAEARKRQPSGT